MGVGSSAGAAASELVALGLEARNDGHTADAYTYFEAAIARDPDDPKPYFEIAVILLNLGLTASAGAWLERALALQPDLPEADLVRGRIAAVHGDALLARRHFQEATRKTPDDFSAYVLVARNMRALGWFEEAVSVASDGLRRCGGDDENLFDLLDERALGLVGLGRLDEAIEILRRLIALRRRADDVTSAGVVLTSSGRFAEAFDLFDRVHADAWLHADDWLSYRGCIASLQRAADILEAARRRVAEDRHAVLMNVRPYVFRDERPLSELDVSAVGSGRPSRYYVVDDLLADGHAGDAALELEDLLRDDLARLQWSPPRRERLAYFQYVLPDCFVYDHLGEDPRSAIVGRDCGFVPDLVTPYSPINTSRIAVLDGGRTVDTELDLAFVAPTLQWDNYYVVVVQVMSSLAIYRRLSLTCPLVLPGPIGPLHAELIRASGVPDGTPLLSLQDVKGAFFRSVICPQVVSGQLLRRWCSDVAEWRSGTARERPADEIVYISRRGLIRPLVNQHELEETLSRKWGARIVRLEEHPLRSQIEIMQGAAVVVAPHGAGLTNIVFARPGTAVVELLTDRYPRSTFAQLAAIASHDYFPIFGPVETEEIMTPEDLRWRIDIEKVERVVDRVVGRAAAATRHD